MCDSELTDTALASEDYRRRQAHKIIPSASSPIMFVIYFKLEEDVFLRLVCNAHCWSRVSITLDSTIVIMVESSVMVTATGLCWQATRNSPSQLQEVYLRVNVQMDDLLMFVFTGSHNQSST